MWTVILFIAVVGAAAFFFLHSKKTPEIKPRVSSSSPPVEKEKEKEKKKQPKVDITANLNKNTNKKDKKEQTTQDSNTHNLLFTSLNAHDGAINDFSLSQDGRAMLTVSTDKTLRVWNWYDKHIQPVYTRISTQLDVGTACALSKDGTLAAVGLTNYKTVKVFKVNLATEAKELHTVEPIIEFKTEHKELISSMIINPTHQFLITASKGMDTSIKLFSPRTGSLLQQIDTKQISNNMACLSDDGRFLSVGAMLSDCRIWSVISSSKTAVFERVEVCMSLKNHKKGVNCVGFWTSELGTTDGAATASIDGNVRFWNLKVQYHIKEEPKMKSCWTLPDSVIPELVACAPGASGVIAVTNGSTLFFYKNTGVLLDQIENAHRGGVIRLKWHSNGKVLASCGGDKHIKLWKSPAVV